MAAWQQQTHARTTLQMTGIIDVCAMCAVYMSLPMWATRGGDVRAEVDASILADAPRCVRNYAAAADAVRVRVCVVCVWTRASGEGGFVRAPTKWGRIDGVRFNSHRHRYESICVAHAGSKHNTR